MDINLTASKLGDKFLTLLLMHPLTGCDTVSYPYGKGKVCSVNFLLTSSVSLKAFVDPKAEEQKWLDEGLQFLAALYGYPANKSLNDVRYAAFVGKRDPSKIKCLPPTDDAGVEHIRCARLQIMRWF